MDNALQRALNRSAMTGMGVAYAKRMGEKYNDMPMMGQMREFQRGDTVIDQARAIAKQKQKVADDEDQPSLKKALRSLRSKFSSNLGQ